MKDDIVIVLIDASLFLYSATMARSATPYIPGRKEPGAGLAGLSCALSGNALS
jgi:hypothetical protein